MSSSNTDFDKLPALAVKAALAALLGLIILFSMQKLPFVILSLSNVLQAEMRFF